MPPSRRALTATLSLLLLAGTAAAAMRAPELIDDDYDAARLQAGQRKVPMVVEVWAPW